MPETDVRHHLTTLLRRSGSHLTSGTHDRMLLRLPNREVVEFAVRTWPTRLTAGMIPPMTVHSTPRTLHAAPSAAEAVVVAARAGDYDLVTASPARVVLNGTVLLDESAHDGTSAGSGRKAWGRWAIERVLAIAGHRTLNQRELAAATGITQQAVSQALRSRRGPHIRRLAGGWTGAPGLLDRWLAVYPGPGGAVTYWYGLDEPIVQARAAIALLGELDVRALVSGDIAADTYAPWRLPSTVLLYVPEIIDFAAAGFSPADPADATMTVVTPEDPTLWPGATFAGRPNVAGATAADPAITLWDLLHTSRGPAVGEAADRLRASIMSELDA